MPTPNRQKRPVYLNLLRIRLPVAGILSILHRASGLLLFLAIPVLLYLLDRSLRSQQGFDFVAGLFDGLIARLALLVMLWALLHHLLSGIRFLLIDLDIGVAREPMRASAWAINLGAPVLTLLAAAMMLT